jgi:N-acyl-D-amino-acid deacylase
VVVFDPDKVIDRATFAEPRQSPEGIHHVVVAGVPVVENGQPTGARPGRAVRATKRV